jgi:GNAT superfamily N-acetyltransferase
MQVQRVVEPDLHDLLPLVRAYCDFNGVQHSDESLLAVSRALIADPDRVGVQFLSRDAAGRAIGFATLVWTWATWAGGRVGIMGDLFVVPSARRVGCGRALVEACRRECGSSGALGLTWTTAKDNTAARSLYESLGARSREWVDYWLDPGSGPRGTGRR